MNFNLQIENGFKLINRAELKNGNNDQIKHFIWKTKGLKQNRSIKPNLLNLLRNKNSKQLKVNKK